MNILKPILDLLRSTAGTSAVDERELIRRAANGDHISEDFLTRPAAHYGRQIWPPPERPKPRFAKGTMYHEDGDFDLHVGSGLPFDLHNTGGRHGR